MPPKPPKEIEVGDLVVCINLKNRWELAPAAEVVEVKKDGLLDLKVWNLAGPGADVKVTNVPISEVELKGD